MKLTDDPVTHVFVVDMPVTSVATLYCTTDDLPMVAGAMLLLIALLVRSVTAKA